MKTYSSSSTSSLDSTTIANMIASAGGGNKIMEMLDKIDSPTEYINAITKLLPYSIGKVKPYEEIEEREPISININFADTIEELELFFDIFTKNYLCN